MIRGPRRWSLSSQIGFALGTLTIVLVSVFGSLNSRRERQRLENKIAATYSTQLTAIASSMTDAIIAEDSALLSEQIKRFGLRDAAIIKLTVKDNLGRSIVDWQREAHSKKTDVSKFSESVKQDDRLVGRVDLVLDLGPLEQEVTDRVIESLVALTIALLLVNLSVSLLIYRLAVAPLQRIDQQVHRMRTMETSKPLSLLGAREFENVAAAIDSFAHQTQVQREKDLSHQEELRTLNDAYFRFVPRQFLAYLKRSSITEIMAGDHTARNITVLFCDIRSFTGYSQRIGAQDTFDFINEFLNRLGPVVRQNSGFIDKYIGDSIMALFESPSDGLRGAVGLIKALEEFNAERRELGKEQIKVGIGLNTGDVMLGIIGESQRLEGTVIGDAVNLAARLESLTKKYKVPVLFSAATLEAVRAERDGEATINGLTPLAFRFVDRVIAKGRQTPSAVYELFENDPPELQARKRALATWRTAEFKRTLGARVAPIESLQHDPLWPVYCDQVFVDANRKLRPTSDSYDIDEEILWS